MASISATKYLKRNDFTKCFNNIESSEAIPRSNHSEVFCRKLSLNVFTGKHVSQRLFLKKVAALRPQVFSCKF